MGCLAGSYENPALIKGRWDLYGNESLGGREHPAIILPGSTVFLEGNCVSQGANGTISVLLNHDHWLANYKNGSLSLFNTSFCLLALLFWLGPVFSSFIWKNLWQGELLSHSLSWHKIYSIRCRIFCCNCSCMRQCLPILLHLRFSHF